MSEKTLFVIVPRLPPSIDGLGDYGYLLANEMMNRFGLKTHFIVGDPDWKGSDTLGKFNVSKVKCRSRLSLMHLLPDKGHVLLHYVGYGYAKRGCPHWLSSSLLEWKTKPDRKLISMMHECYAKGPIWNSQFWTYPLQKFILGKLSKCSDKCITSKASYAQIIQKLSHHKHHNITVLPVFSNVGEPAHNMPVQIRKRSLIVFGGAAWRRKAYFKSHYELLQVIKTFGIETVIDIGSVLNMPTGLEGSVDIKLMGNLSADEISKIFSESRFGFLNYPTDYLTKSGIFAAYCAHGLIPINADEFRGKNDLLENEIFLKAQDIQAFESIEKQQQISLNAYNWYQGHNLKIHANKFKEILD